MALLAIVPVLGPFVVWMPVAIFLALERSEPARNDLMLSVRTILVFFIATSWARAL